MHKLRDGRVGVKMADTAGHRFKWALTKLHSFHYGNENSFLLGGEPVVEKNVIDSLAHSHDTVVIDLSLGLAHVHEVPRQI